MSYKGSKSRGNEAFPINFFNALSRGDDDTAFRHLGEEAFVEGAPSPRTQRLIESGEWDGNQKLSLVLIEASACPGRVGQDKDLRFCGKPPKYCAVQTHSKNTVGPIRKGWYISLGKAHGVLATPFLPTVEDGGPITGFLAGRLLQTGDSAFRLTKGQWKFIVDAWHASKVETLSSSEVSSETSDDEGAVAASITPTLRFQFKDPPLKPKPEEAIAQDEEELSQSSNHQFTSSAELESVLSRQKEMDTEIRYLATQYAALTDQKREEERRVRTLEERLRALQETNNHVVGVHAQTVNALRERILGLEAKVEENDTYAGGTTHGVAQMTQQVMDKINELDIAMFADHGAFHRFKESFIEFKEKLESGGGVECHGISFRSYRDFMNWYDREGPTADLFLDALAYMHAVRAPVVHTDDATKQLELQDKTSMTTALEAAVVTSFQTILPSVLVGGGGKKGDSVLGGTFDWLSGYLKTFKVWKPTGTTNGVSHQITQGVSNVTKRVTELRRRHISPEVLILSSGLCQDSALFCNELVRFVNEQQEDLVTNTTYTDEQIWQMQLECIQRIVEELHEAREAFADAGRQHRGNFVWGMLMAWRVQQRYMDNHFKDDPALTGVLVRRVLLQGQDTSVKKQLSKIDATATQVEELKRKQAGEIANVKAEISKMKADIAAKK
jgi:hypothetical protein